jgi:adenylate cyclase
VSEDGDGKQGEEPDDGAEATTERVATILAADAVGYSRLMADDEKATIAALDRARAVFTQHIEANRGRVVDTAGDSVLAVIDTTNGAVRASVAIQEGLAALNEDVPEPRQMQFRIGIHLGDIHEKADGTIYGDGVNVAARLEGIADPGGIAVSGMIHGAVDGRLNIAFADIGEQEVKNIARPVHAYRIISDTRSAEAPPREARSRAERPSVAVLAFENLSGDAEQEYFADGIAEDLITELSRLRWLQVTARNSSFTYKGQAIDVRQVGSDLGVRYVVEGSVRKGGERVRITAQLIDAESGNHIWAERYDRDLSDIFALQDEITETLVATLQTELGEFERERAHRKPPRSLDAWQAYQRGLWHLYELDAENIPKSRKLLRAAFDLDADFAQPYAAMGFSYFIELTNFSDGSELEMKLEQALRYASQAVALDDKDALAHFTLGRVQTMRGDYEAAIAESRIAIDLSPSSVPAHYGLGVALWWKGQLDEAISELDTAIRLAQIMHRHHHAIEDFLRGHCVVFAL